MLGLQSSLWQPTRRPKTYFCSCVFKSGQIRKGSIDIHGFIMQTLWQLRKRMFLKLDLTITQNGTPEWPRTVSSLASSSQCMHWPDTKPEARYYNWKLQCAQHIRWYTVSKICMCTSTSSDEHLENATFGCRCNRFCNSAIQFISDGARNWSRWRD